MKPLRQTESIRELLSNSSRTVGSQTALAGTNGELLTYPELLTQVDCFIDQLRERGIGRNDRVALVLPNGLEMALAFLGTAAGAAAAPLNPDYRVSEFNFYLADLRPKAIIVLSGSLNPVRQSAAELGIPVLELDNKAVGQAVTMRLSGSTPYARSQDGPAETEDIALILHTSGTTSRPKMVPLTQRNLFTSSGNIAETLRLEPTDRCLNVMPLFHIHGLMAALMASLRAGGSVICTPGFSAVGFYRFLNVYRPTWYTAVPTMHQSILVRSGDKIETVAQSQLRFIRSSSASLPPQVMADLEKTFRVPVIESYGMTEASHQMASNPLPPAARKPGSVGPSAGPEIAIMREDSDELLSRKQTGEIVIRGPNITGGYLENPEANKNAFSAGWFRTGDQGFFDEQGYLTITGRLKEIINRGGEKITPREIDEALFSHQSVDQAVAFAIPDPLLGEEVAAAVVLNHAQQVTVKELQKHVAATLADFKVPRRILLVDEIPKGSTGKLQRIGLAKQLGLDKVNAAEAAPASLAERADPEVELFLQELWCQILDQTDIPVFARFIELGGDSVQAARLVNQIRSQLDIDLTLVDFFDAPTIAHQAIVIQEKIIAQEVANIAANNDS